MNSKSTPPRLARILKASCSTFAFLALSSLGLQAADASGTWKWTVTTQNGDTIQSSAKLKQEGNKLTGTYIGRSGTESKIEDGTVKEGEISFKVVRERDGQKFTVKHQGKLSGDTITGKVEADFNGQTFSRDWEAKREKALANATGTWKWEFTRDNGEKMEFSLKFKEENQKLTGVSISPNGSETEIAEGKTKDNEISFKVSRERDGRTIVAKFQGKIEGDTITGKIQSDFSGEDRTYDWLAKRAKE